MSEEHRNRNVFEGYHIAEDDEVEKALQEYKAADEKVWGLMSTYLYPPEGVPHEGTRELVFPNVTAQNEYLEARQQAQAARERYESVARARQQKQGDGGHAKD
jgi:hypothetical protein